MSILILKRMLGCWIHERPRMECVLLAPTLARRAGIEWQDLCNRHETVSRCEDGIGRVCHWRHSSFLTVGQVFPSTGGRLLRHAWSGAIDPPQPPLPPVSVILPVRGADRSASVACVADALRRIAGPAAEVLICEHDETPRYGQTWPAGVRSLFVRARQGEAFNKSKAMNAGALAARHPYLLFHDADVVPPPDYCVRSLALLASGWDAVRPVRFLFLLDEANSRIWLQSDRTCLPMRIASVHQNFPGVATFMRRDVYLELGGHDERFEGWGGEDLEFLERLGSRRLYPGSFLPAMHLWHPSAEQKRSGHRNAELLDAILREPLAQRLAEGRQRLARPATA